MRSLGTRLVEQTEQQFRRFEPVLMNKKKENECL